VAWKHLHHRAHPPVPVAWPEMARGGPATCAGGQARGISGGGVLRRCWFRESVRTRWSTTRRMRWCMRLRTWWLGTAERQWQFGALLPVHGNGGQRPAAPSPIGRLWRPAATNNGDGSRMQQDGRSSERWWLQRRSSAAAAARGGHGCGKHKRKRDRVNRK
jgi:hypothetical protein